MGGRGQEESFFVFPKGNADRVVNTAIARLRLEGSTTDAGSGSIRTAQIAIPQQEEERACSLLFHHLRSKEVYTYDITEICTNSFMHIQYII